LTVRTIIDKNETYGVRTYDEITLPVHKHDYWYMGEPDKWPLPARHKISNHPHSIFLGARGATDARLIMIPRDGPMNVKYAQAQNQTIIPEAELINVRPVYMADPDTVNKYELCPRNAGGQFLSRKYLPLTQSWKYIYEKWYIFDKSRVPDYRKASVYMGHARFGIHAYTAELKIEAFSTWRPWFLRNNGYMAGFLRPKDTRMLDKVLRATRASMALRDTIHIDTIIMRRINTNDSLPCDGSFTVGEYIHA